MLEDLTPFSELDSLRHWVASQHDQQALRERLWQRFRDLVEYEDADDWSEAVALCEVMAIVGWGDRERVDAISHFNGDCWDTYFRTETGGYRYRHGKWRKNKAGWLLFNPEYHFSKDLPDRPARSWRDYAGADFPILDREHLPSQRNYTKQVPIVMGLIGGGDSCSETVWGMKRQLDALLRVHMTPQAYGEPLEFLYFTLKCSLPGSPSGRGLKIGSYRSKQRAFYCDLHFDRSFASRPVSQRIDYFEANLNEAVKALREKFHEKRLAYDFERFCQHLQTAFTAMRGASTSTST
jgi:hypothetical protein